MKTLLVPMLAVVSLASCATNRMSDTDRLALYEAHAGEPVKQVRYTSTQGWDRVDDQHIVLSTRSSESWLLTMSGPCLSWGGTTPVIRLETGMTGILTPFDRIHTPDTPASCQIREIRPLDVKALRAAESEARAKAQASGT